MKQPDTAALRERLANYTPEDELEQDKQELEGLLQEVNYQLIELRNLLKEVNALKEELHGIHGSLKHTVQRERTAFNALVAAKDSADNIVNGINRAIVKAEQHTVIRAEIGTDEMEKCINAQSNTSRPKKNCWRSTALKWPNTSKAMKEFGSLHIGLLFCNYTVHFLLSCRHMGLVKMKELQNMVIYGKHRNCHCSCYKLEHIELPLIHFQILPS